jgi:hypothetical protein
VRNLGTPSDSLTPLYAFVGALGGAVVTAAFWFGMGTDAVWTSGAICAGAVLGAGVLTGDGSVQEAWSGWIGALVVPPVFIAVLNALLILVLSSYSQ